MADIHVPAMSIILEADEDDDDAFFTPPSTPPPLFLFGTEQSRADADVYAAVESGFEVDQLLANESLRFPKVVRWLANVRKSKANPYDRIDLSGRQATAAKKAQFPFSPVKFSLDQRSKGDQDHFQFI